MTQSETPEFPVPGGEVGILVDSEIVLSTRYADYSMYSTFLTASPGSVLFSRSNLLKRKDLCFSCLRLGLIRHRRSLRSSHLFSSGSTRFCRVTTREADILVKSFFRTVFCDWFTEQREFLSVSLFFNRVTSDVFRRVPWHSCDTDQRIRELSPWVASTQA